MSMPQGAAGGPQDPETEVYADRNDLKGVVTFVEDSLEPGSWIEADDQHVWLLRDME